MMQLQVNPQQRYAKMRAHTATHLLHTVLTTYFPNTKQAGSLVDSDFLRFDFYADTLLTIQQIKEIEITINTYIYQSLPVELIETSLDEANKLGAKSFFEEKYDDQVRVIRILDGEATISAELCGGTHVVTTREIGAFTIISQEAVASGIKRLTALTGPKVIEKLHEKEEILQDLVKQLDIKSFTQISEKVQKMLKEFEELTSKMESLDTSLLQQTLKTGEKKSNEDFSCIMELPITTNFKMLPNVVKQILGELPSALFYTSEGSYLILTDGKLSAKSLVGKYDLKGGGSETSAQGKDMKVREI